MNTLILCDRKSTDSNENLLSELQNILVELSHEVSTIVLNHNNFLPCTGCFGCWVKTPGQCVITNDSANSIASKQVNADALIFLSEVTFGGFSNDVKAFLDRSIQNILPLFEIYKGEMHHPKRYDHFPIWIAIGYGDVSDSEKQIFHSLADRNALNKRPERYLSLVVQGCSELIDKAPEIKQILEVSK
jgi:multimeric flavodoxin WrbA